MGDLTPNTNAVADAPTTKWKYTGVANGIQDTVAVALKTAVAGKSIYLDRISIVNTDATVGTEVVILSAGTVIWRGYAPPVGASPQHIYFDDDCFTVAGEALNVQAVTTSAQLIVSARGRY